MNNCHVFHPEQSRGEELVTLDFSGNRPALPPLTTEAVASVIYEMDEDVPSHERPRGRSLADFTKLKPAPPQINQTHLPYLQIPASQDANSSTP